VGKFFTPIFKVENRDVRPGGAVLVKLGQINTSISGVVENVFRRNVMVQKEIRRCDYERIVGECGSVGGIPPGSG
jgi:hypothetical protein